MTLKDIAAEAGVATSTVSRILNNKGPGVASKELQDRVWEIVRRTGYIPNSSARNLRAGTPQPTQDGKSLACMYARSPTARDNPFFTNIARSIEEEAFSRHYFLRYSFSTMDFSSAAVMHPKNGDRLRGIAVLGRCDKTLLHDLKGVFKHVVYTGLVEVNANYDQVICDGFHASQMAMEYLVSCGHKNIGFVGETVNEIRFHGYQDVVKAKSLPDCARYVENRTLSAEGGYLGAQALLARAPEITAIFCSNDQTATGVIRAVREMGLRIPEDLSVIGIDDIEESRFLSPPLTTIHIPTEEMGCMAAKLLIDRIEGGHSIPVKMYLPCFLLKRESCAAPGSRSRKLPPSPDP